MARKAQEGMICDFRLTLVYSEEKHKAFVFSRKNVFYSETTRPSKLARDTREKEKLQKRQY